MKQQIAIVAALFAVVLLVTHLLAGAHDWYETRFLFDKYMHFLGGAFVFFTLAMYFLRHIPMPFTGRQLFVLIVFSLIVGLLWEAFEYIVQHFTGVLLATIPDSIGDVVFDLLGAIVGANMLWWSQSFVGNRKKRYNGDNKWNHLLEKN